MEGTLVASPHRPAASTAASAASAARRDGQGGAFAALYLEQYPRVLGYLRHRVGGLAEAEDLTSEVFRIAWERSQEVALSAPWLFVTAHNVWRNHVRREVRLGEVRTAIAGQLAVQVQSMAGGEAQEGRVIAAMDGLPPEHRDILMMRYWDDLNGAECAAILGCSVPAVWMRLNRARAAFRAKFEAMGREEQQ
ncbi:MAG: RNA polymerase sigma factor [Bifidobacteriaceae bacterium]|jgi:RNA polymerase sigma-70 factor (ECF subfamily)|nr:RNA polymerase sigma factor [Bifidobacteriaceae bacterium]